MDPMRWLEAQDHEEPWHNLRYVLSAEWIEPIMATGTRILELGSCSIFTELLSTKFPGVTIEGTNFDMRYDFPVVSQSIDVVLCMEVLEHIQDRDPRSDYERAAFTGSGILHMLEEIRRVLQPNGWLFLTTPNVCGWHNLFRLCDHAHPFFYSLHHRELSPACVYTFLQQTGFSIDRLETPVVWNHQNTPQSFMAAMDTFLDSGGFRTDLRGDDIFVMARVARP